MEENAENCDLCLICGERLSVNKTVSITQRGLPTLVQASKARNDQLYTSFCVGILLHTSCRKQYTRSSSITEAAKANDVNHGDIKVRRSTSGVFNFKEMCLYCGKNVENKLKQSCIRSTSKVHQVEYLHMRESVLKYCDKRQDEWSRQVFARVHGEHTHDLVAAEARYHKSCKNSFEKINITEKRKGRPVSDTKFRAFENLCSHMIESEDCQFSMKELQNVFSSSLPNESKFDTYSDFHLSQKLHNHFGDSLIQCTSAGKTTIFCLRDAGTKLLRQFWEQNKTQDEETDKINIVTTAAKIIKSEIQSKIFSKKNYPSEQDMKTGGKSCLPKLLILFFITLLTPLHRATSAHCERLCITLSNCVLAATRPRSFISPILLGLGVYLHRTFGSREVIDIFHSLGLCESYNEVDRFEAVSTCNNQTEIKNATFAQFVFDNADFNTRTIDGHNTFHAMGGIMCLAPVSAAIKKDILERPKTTPSLNEIAKNAYLPLSHYFAYDYNNGRFENFRIINVFNLLSEPPKNLFTAQTMDLLCMSGPLLSCQKIVGWTGYMISSLKNSQDINLPPKNKIIPLPFINLDPSNPSAIYSALSFAVDQSKKIGLRFCIVTFDQPLYYKAARIITSSHCESDISKIILRLGGFHLLMSFMGSVGYIMSGSGLSELWETVYAKTSVVHMLTGHHFSRACRAHLMTQQALLLNLIENLNMEIDTNNLRRMYDEIFCDGLSSKVTDLPVLSDILKKLHTLMENAAVYSRTAKLWLQYWDLVDIMRLYIRAERTGDWQLHLHCVRNMLPFFHAAGHLNYAKSAHLYLQEMIKLSEILEPDDYKLFIENFPVRRNDGPWNGNWSDMSIEQTLMRSMKTNGGLTRGRGISETTIAKWIGSTLATMSTIEAIEEFCNFKSAKNSEQHKDFRDSSINRDSKDLKLFTNFLRSHSPFDPNLSSDLRSIADGICANEMTNCDNARDIGIQAINKIVGDTFFNAKLTRSFKVKTLAAVINSVIVNNEIIPINHNQIFHRIICTANTREQKETCLSYELSMQPPSIFHNGGLRKGNKAVLAEYLATIGPNVLLSDVPEGSKFIVDGGMILHRVIWRRPATYNQLFVDYTNHINTNFPNCHVVFDSYTEVCTKQSERDRRQYGRKLRDVIFDPSMDVAVGQEDFLSNERNKQQFINYLAESLRASGISVLHAEGDADYLIVMTALQYQSQCSHVTVVSEDTDVLILLAAHGKRTSKIACLQHKTKAKRRIFDISAIILALGPLKSVLLFCHAVTGCDTTSAIYGNGKTKALKLLKNDAVLRESVSIFTTPRTKKEDIETIGCKFLLTLYHAPCDVVKLEKLRYYSYMVSTGKKSIRTGFDLASLPPTTTAAKYHMHRVYHQVQEWIGINLPPEEWGWKITEAKKYVPICNTEQPAPEWILQMATCACKTGCKTARCSCRRAGTHCTDMCQVCHGMECSNSVTIEIDDLNR